MSISENNNNIRIRTTPLGSDKFLKVNINQNFDFLEILSLKIGQEQVYRKYCSDYGVIAGRVVCNGGVGVPNAKISVFIPISDIDSEDPTLRSLYPYKSLEDVDYNNVKYNLLLETPRQDDLCHRSVGTFPEKRRILDCDPLCEIYGKYYKYSTSTNESGDYMIFGVPVGVHTLHMDVDLSDIGYLSQKPYDMVSQGSPITMFDSLNQFKSSTNLSELPQIKTQNKTINVVPFWGDLDQCQVGINRLDYELNYKITPTAFFVGSIFGDSGGNSINKNCQVGHKLGRIEQLVTGEGTIQMIRKTPEGGTEVYEVNGGRVIDDDGTWVTQIPMNLNTKVTDEFGNLVDSGNPEVGIPTSAKYRFKIGINDFNNIGRVRSRAKFLVPNYGDYSFDDTTPEFITTNGGQKPNFAELEWNGVYTIKQFISRFSNLASTTADDYIGIKNVSEYGNTNPFPYNTINTGFKPLFNLLCIIAQIIGSIVILINLLIDGLNVIIDLLNDLLSIFDADIKYLDCVSISVDGNSYCPGCSYKNSGNNCNDDLDAYFQAITNTLAVSLDAFEFDFINDWINGSLFAFLFKVKPKSNGGYKFCDVDKNFGSNYIKGYDCNNSGYNWSTVEYTNGGVIKYIEDTAEFFYAAVDNNHKWLYPTDIYRLGSMKNCDIFGKPKIVTSIPSTSFNIPSLSIDYIDPSSGSIERGTEHLLADISCFGLSFNDDQCRNLFRECEIGVDYDDDYYHDLLDNGDIDDTAAFIRSELECLNVPSICSNCDDSIDGKFDTDWKNYRTGDYYVAGGNYSEGSRVNLQRRELIKNSFYFYFGIHPGKTAMDKIQSQYFAPCERVEPCIIFISGSVENNKCVGGHIGSITVNPKYGTPPYTYDWYLGYYNFGGNNTPLSLNSSSNSISQLYSDNYTVLVSDSVGNICKKTFTVLDPPPFSVLVEYSPYICPGSNNGFINVIPSGGNPPYTIDWSSGIDVTINSTENTVDSFFLTNLIPTSVCSLSSVGYIGTVSDSSNSSCINLSSITISIVQSCGFTVTGTTIDDYCPTSNKGSITWGPINGGVAPFTYILESNDYYWSGKSNSLSIIRKNLSGDTCPGIIYTATCIDSCGSINASSFNIIKTELRCVPDCYTKYERTEVGSNYRSYYFSLFAGPSNITPTFINSCPNANDGSGGFYGGNIISNRVQNPESFWYVFPTNGNSDLLLYSSVDPNDNIGLQVHRYDINSTESEVWYSIYGGNSVVHSDSNTFRICKNETLYLFAGLLNQNDDCKNCKWGIKMQGCATKVMASGISC